MSSSLVLLLVLQGFWVYNSYERAYFMLRREMDGLFRNTVITLRDSSLMQFVETMPADSSGTHGHSIHFTQKIDTAHLPPDAQVRVSGNAESQMSIFITSATSTDSIKRLIKPLVGKVRAGRVKEGNFVVRFGPDSLRLDSIRNYFSKTLRTASRELPFIIKRESQVMEGMLPSHLSRLMRNREADGNTRLPAEIFSDTLKTNWVQTDPVNRYAASITGVRAIVLKEITPQILFSFFLTMLTSVAFLFMYRSLRTQQKLMQLKNDFISNVTHELKTPVTTVSVALEALRNFKGLENPQRTEEYLNIAQSELNRLTILTDKILKTAIFESKGVNFETESVDLFLTLEQVLHSMKLVFEKQKAQVTFEKQGDTFTIHGGSVHLTNVIYNLLDNALKYSEGEPSISISLAENENQVILKVADKGIGIPKEYNKKIFEKFFRVPMGDVHTVKGYGLGLSYVESVIKIHKGKIEVQSEHGKGSTFTIWLPKLQATPAP